MKPKIPDRIIGPSWLVKPGGTEKEIAQDLTAMSFWMFIDTQAAVAALKNAKQLPGWKPRQHLVEQSAEIQKEYTALLEVATEDLIKTIGDDTYSAARMLAESIDNGFDRTQELGDTFERVQVELTLQLKRQGLLKYLECDNVTEYILSKARPLDDDGKRQRINYDIDFFVDYLIPTLEASGVSKDLLLGVADNFLKARYAIPYLRQVLNEVIAKADEIRAAIRETEDDEEKANLDKALDEVFKVDTRLKDILLALAEEMAVNSKQGGMSVREFQKKMSHITHSTEPVQKVLGYIYNMPKGGVITITVDTVSMLNAIKGQLNSLVDWHMGDPVDLANELKNNILKGGSR